MQHYIGLILLLSLGSMQVACAVDTTSSPIYADKAHYLVDSLVLEEMAESDRQLLDTAMLQYHQAKTDSARYQSLAVLAEGLMHEVWFDYNVLLLEELQQKLQSSDQRKEGEHFFQGLLSSTLSNVGYYAEHHEGNIPKAIEYYEKALAIDRQLGDSKDIAAVLLNLGLVRYQQGDVQKGIDMLDESLKLYEQVKDLQGQGRTVTALGGIYEKQGEYEKAQEYFQKGLELYTTIDDKEGIVQALTWIGFMQLNQKQFHKALQNFQRGVELSEEIGDYLSLGTCLQNIGVVYFKMGVLDTAMQYYQESLTIREKTGDRNGYAATLTKIGNVWLQMGNYRSAAKIADESKVIAQSLGYIEVMQQAVNLQFQIAKHDGEWQQAYELHQKLVNLKDSVINLENQKTIVQQQLRYQYEKERLAAEKEQEKKDALAAEEKLRQNVTLASVSGGLILVVLLSIFLFNRFKVTHQQKQIIEGQKLEVEMQKQMVETKNKEITDSINYAKRIQNAMLPSARRFEQRFPESFILYRPKAIVAGDFYWMETVGSTTIFAVADCTGHGVPGALVSVVCHNALNRAVREFKLIEPDKILNKVRELVIETFSKREKVMMDGMDIALCTLDDETKVLQFAGANNPMYVIRKKTGALPEGAVEDGELYLEEIQSDRQPIGAYPKNEPFRCQTVSIQPGDQLVLFSDGFADQFGGPKGKKLKYLPFKQLLLEHALLPLPEQGKALEKAFQSWCGDHEQIDDLCIIGIRM